MNIKSQGVFVLFFFFSVCAYAQNSAEIKLENKEGRTQAVVPAREPVREKPAGFLGQSFYLFESGILTVARSASSAAGTVADSTVWGVQKSSDIVFAPIMKALDIRRWFHHGGGRDG